MMTGAGLCVLLPFLLFGEPPAESAACEDPARGPRIESAHEPAVHAEWLRATRHRVHAKWNRPRLAPESEGATVVLRFVVGKRGKVRELETLCATGDRAFEKASRRAVKAASPLATLPEESEQDSLTLRWRFRYEQRDAVVEEKEYPAETWVR